MPDPSVNPAGRPVPLCGKAALVTGAARRVGSAIAQALHAAGAGVVLHYRSSGEEAAALAQQLNGLRQGSAVLAQCDLLDGAAVKELARTAAAAFGGLDILVNNASSFYPTPLGDIDEDDW